jgi:hypothetical protein
LLELEVKYQRNLKKQAPMELDPTGTSRREATDRPATPPNSSPTLYLSISK